MFTRHLFFKFFLFALMTLIASIITFSKKKKKKIGKKYVTLDPRHGTLAHDMEPSTLDKKIDSLPLTKKCQLKQNNNSILRINLLSRFFVAEASWLLLVNLQKYRESGKKRYNEPF